MAITDPKVTITSLLKTNWSGSNTSGVTPTFSTGWFDEKAQHPMVTITNESEATTGGGNTGYFGIDGAGGTAHQQIVGSVDVNVWSTRDDSSSVNPKQLTFEMSEEVKRIVRANYLSATDLDFISWGGRLERVDTNQSPTSYRYLCQVTYGYLET